MGFGICAIIKFTMFEAQSNTMTKEAPEPIMAPVRGQGDRFIQPEAILRLIGLPAGAQVGHFGCGNGYFTFAAARLIGDMGRVYAVDVQRSILEQVKKEARLENLPNIEIVWSDLEVPGATNIPARSLDFILMVNVIFQVKAKRTFFEEAKRLLKDGGEILLVDWKKEKSHLGPPLDMRVSPDEVRRLAGETGFAEKSTFEAGRYHYGALFGKK